MITTFIRRSVIVIALCAAFSAPVLAQFAYECYPLSGRSYISKNKCPEGMSWRQVQTDPYYIDRSATRQSNAGTLPAAKPKSNGGRSSSELSDEYSRAMKSGDWGAAIVLRQSLKHAQRMEEIAAGGTVAPEPEQRRMNCMPNGMGGMTCR